jgi:hypothetical protein
VLEAVDPDKRMRVMTAKVSVMRSTRISLVVAPPVPARCDAGGVRAGSGRGGPGLGPAERGLRCRPAEACARHTPLALGGTS